MKRLRSRAGQVSIEMALMMVVSVTIIALVTQTFRSNQLFATMVSGPWQSLAGLIQNGVMGSVSSTYSQHPNQFVRVTSPVADPPEAIQ